MDLVWLLIWTDQFVRTPHLDNLENLSMDWVLDDIKQLLIIIDNFRWDDDMISVRDRNWRLYGWNDMVPSICFKIFQDKSGVVVDSWNEVKEWCLLLKLVMITWDFYFWVCLKISIINSWEKEMGLECPFSLGPYIVRPQIEESVLDFLSCSSPIIFT